MDQITKAEWKLAGRCVDCGDEELHSEFVLPNPFMEDLDEAEALAGLKKFDVCKPCYLARIMERFRKNDTGGPGRWDS